MRSLLFLSLMALGLAGCGSARIVSEQGQSFLAYSVTVTGDAPAPFMDAIRSGLSERQAGDSLKVSCHLINQSPGSRFGRWLWPGNGTGRAIYRVDCSGSNGQLHTYIVEGEVTGGAFGGSSTLADTYAGEEAARRIVADHFTIGK